MRSSDPLLNDRGNRSQYGAIAIEGTTSYPTTVRNAGSTARDHFALERNFLSWLRTCLTLTVVGFSTFFHFHTFLNNDEKDLEIECTISVMLIYVGILVLICATISYFRLHSKLINRCVKVENGKLEFCNAFTVGVTMTMVILACFFCSELKEEA
ncbi:209_t:CDS:2, partial [Acaulospora morrowiae]